MASMRQVVIEVLGTPAAKGSLHARVHNGRVVVHEGKRTKAWERLVREHIAVQLFGGALPDAPMFVDVPLTVGIVFRLARPSGHWGKSGLKPRAAPMPHRKPDIDKLARATLDPLIGSVIDDDSRIVELNVRKTYAAPGQEGARIVVEEWSPT